ncbi:hypothetical protein ACFV30_42775, partial [Streptomyces sp. NPDC059752]|uniref:hypothetical protein n=1 Tax=unclassified Streptomyces TaxID=2593676 RepID=UPI003648F188
RYEPTSTSASSNSPAASSAYADSEPHSETISNPSKRHALTDEEQGHRACAVYAACYAARYELAVLAPQSVLTRAKDFDRCARDLRDLIIEGAGLQAQSREGMQKYLDALGNCQNLWITRYTLAG